MRFKGLLILIGVLCLSQAKSQMVRFGGNITGISYTQVSGDTFQIRGTFNDLTGVSVGTDLDSNDVYWTPPLNAGDTCRRARVISADTLFVGFVVFTVDMQGQGNPSTQNSKVMRETPNQNLDYIPQGGDQALRECISQYYSNILDDKLGQGGGLASVLVDSVTIFGDGLNTQLYVDSTLFVTYSAFQDSLGDGMYQEVFIADGILNTYQVTLDTVLPNDTQDILIAWNGQLLDDEYIGALDANNATLQLTFTPDSGDRIAIIWFDGDVQTQSGGIGGLDSVFTSMRLIGNGTLLNPLDIDTMYVASKEYVDNSIAEAGGGDITGVNESPQYGIDGGGASGAILLEVDTSVIANFNYVASQIDQTRLTQDTILVYSIGGVEVGRDTLVLGQGTFIPDTITVENLGNSATASALKTARTIALGSDLSGSQTFDGSGNITINGAVLDDSHNHIISNVDNLQTTLDGKVDDFIGTGLVKSTAGTVSYVTDNSSSWNLAYNDKVNNIGVSGTTTKTITLTQQDGGTLTTNFTDLQGTGVTISNSGNRRVPVITTSTNIDGNTGWWINTSGELVDNQSEGLSGASTGYDFKMSGSASIGTLDVATLNPTNAVTFQNSITVNGSSTFDGSVGDSYFYPSGALAVQTTPSGNLSLTTKYGALFNTDNNSLYGDVRMNGATVNNMFNLDASNDAISIGGATGGNGYDLFVNKGLYVNQSKSGGVNDGLLVSGDNFTYLLNADADRDKVGINKFQPAYTLDVDGDINFTGALRKNGTEVALSNSFVMHVDLSAPINTQRIMIPSIYNGCTIDYANLTTTLTSWTGTITLEIGSVSGGSYSSSSLTSWSYTSGSGIQADENSGIGHTISSNYVIQGQHSTTSGTIGATVISFAIECN
jgi:hypothetical protein